MQLWMEINVVTLHKITEKMPQQMCAIIKEKGIQQNIIMCDFSFLAWECIVIPFLEIHPKT